MGHETLMSDKFIAPGVDMSVTACHTVLDNLQDSPIIPLSFSNCRDRKFLIGPWLSHGLTRLGVAISPRTATCTRHPVPCIS